MFNEAKQILAKFVNQDYDGFLSHHADLYLVI